MNIIFFIVNSNVIFPEIKLDSLITSSARQENNLLISGSADRSQDIRFSPSCVQNETIVTAECGVAVNIFNTIGNSDISNEDCWRSNENISVEKKCVEVKSEFIAISDSTEDIIEQNVVTFTDMISCDVSCSTLAPLSVSMSDGDVSISPQNCFKEDTNKSSDDLNIKTILNQVQVLNTVERNEISEENVKIVSDEADSYNTADRIVYEVEVSISELLETARTREENASKRKEEKSVKFRVIIDPSRNVQAEQELSREITKDMFSEVRYNHYLFTNIEATWHIYYFI